MAAVLIGPHHQNNNNISEDVNLLQRRCENFKFDKKK
jgi:hypothetical protein